MIVFLLICLLPSISGSCLPKPSEPRNCKVRFLDVDDEHAFRVGIIIRDYLGCDVSYISSDGYTIYQRIDSIISGKVDVSMKLWIEGDEEVAYAEKAILNGKVVMMPSGLTAQNGWYIPRYMLNLTGLDNYRLLREPSVASLFKRGNSTRGVLYSKDNWGYEDIYRIANLGLYLERVTYNDFLVFTKDILYQALMDNLPILFMHWDPSPILAIYDLYRVQLPLATTSCYKKSQLIDCDYPIVNIKISYNTDFAARESRIIGFIQSFITTTREQNEVYKLVYLYNLTIEQAACEWVKNNTERWKQWVPNEKTSTNSSSSMAQWIIILICVFSAALSISLIVGGIVIWKVVKKYLKLRKLYSNENAASKCVEAIATLRFDQVEWLLKLENPSNIHKSLIQIIKTIQELSNYVPDALITKIGNRHVDTGKVSAGVLTPSHKESSRSSVRSINGLKMMKEWTIKKGVFMNVSIEFAGSDVEKIRHCYEKAIVHIITSIKNNHGTINRIDADGINANWGISSHISEQHKLSCIAANQIQSITFDEGTNIHIAITCGRIVDGLLNINRTAAFLLVGFPVRMSYQMLIMAKELNVPVIIDKDIRERAMYHFNLVAIGCLNIENTRQKVYKMEYMKNVNSDEWMYEIGKMEIKPTEFDLIVDLVYSNGNEEALKKIKVFSRNNPSDIYAKYLYKQLASNQMWLDEFN